MNQDESTLLGFLVEEVRSLREQNRVDHQAVLSKIDDLVSDVRIATSAAAAARRLSETNALDIERLQSFQSETREAFEQAGGLKKLVANVLHLVGDHERAKAVEEGERRVKDLLLSPVRKAVDELPRAVILLGSGMLLGTGYVIRMVS